MYPIREEVASICDEYNKTAFDFGESPNKCVFESQGGADAHNDSNQKTAEKNCQKDANGFKQREYCQAARGARVAISLCRLEQNDGDGIVQNGLAKDDRIELGLDFVNVEDGKDSDWVRGRKSSTDGKGFDKRYGEAIKGYPSP